MNTVALGLDFGTESVRALLVDASGREQASASSAYAHGQIIRTLPGGRERLPEASAFQHPQDWIEAAAIAVRAALVQAGGVKVSGIGVAFTSCTVLPAYGDGRPLCLDGRFAQEPMAWPKLWKHHGAGAQTGRINHVARERDETFLSRYGGGIGIEWLFPKILETFEKAPAVFDATDVWLEAGDWLVWQLIGGNTEAIPRSTCQAGYKAMWNREQGYPSEAFFEAVHPGFGRVLEKLPGRPAAPGSAVGGLCPEMARQLGLPAGIAVSAAIIDAHAGVPGAGAYEPGTLVMVMGTSSCHMLNAEEERFVPGMAGVVRDGILPGLVGYEAGQAAVGDAFDWLRVLTGQPDFSKLSAEASLLPPGADGVRCLDWLNGCRTPLMEAGLSGVFSGLTLSTMPGHLYKALLEASAFGLKWIVELFRENGVPVRRFVATGGLPHHNPLIVQAYASVLGEPVIVHPCRYGPALGAAILGALAGGLHSSVSTAIQSMAEAPGAPVILPNVNESKIYGRLYGEYRAMAADFSTKARHP